MTNAADTKKSDSQLKHDVLDELKRDTRTKEADVGVEVKSGVVTLSGSVDSWPARLRAEEAAHRVAGVLDVADDVTVKIVGADERDDSDLARTVRTALEWDALVPSQRIRSTVSNGEVTLEGTVESWGQYEDAARAVRYLPGVRAMRNLIQVEPPAPTEGAARRTPGVGADVNGSTIEKGDPTATSVPAMGVTVAASAHQRRTT
jgi:osmotically-inducible protein OsmY